MHLFEVTGDKADKLDVKLQVGSRVNDYMLVGVAFSGDSNQHLVAVPYDFANLVIWSGVF